MVKKGFTLAESLIALAIISVVAVLVLPLVNKFKPDITKVNFLRAYDSLVNVTNIIISDDSKFPVVVDTNDDGIDDTDYSKAPLYYTGGETARFCNFLQKAIGDPDEQTISCKDELAEDVDYEKSFTTVNGTEFMVLVGVDSSNNFSGEVVIDVDSEGKNCIYNATTCPNPDRFKFLMAPNGQIRPGDAYAKYYLDTRANLRKVEPVTTLSTPSKPEYWDDMKPIIVVETEQTSEGTSNQTTEPSE